MVMRTSLCLSCGKSFVQNTRGTRKFCSSACRVAFHRAKVNADKPADYRSPVEKAIDTKHDKNLRLRECPGCHIWFSPTAAQGKKRFCSDKCKMAYHRRWDFMGTYSSKKPSEAFYPPTAIEVTYNEQEAVKNAWIEGIEA